MSHVDRALRHHGGHRRRLDVGRHRHGVAGLEARLLAANFPVCVKTITAGGHSAARSIWRYKQPPSMRTPLLFTRRFAPMFCCQFFAAFNDNFLKTALVFVILFGEAAANTALVTLAG